MRLLLSAFLLAYLSQATGQSISCDRVVSNTCYIDSNKEFDGRNGGTTISPGTLVGGSGIENLEISPAVVVRCFGDYCSLRVQGFSRFVVAGTLEGSDIIINVSDELEVDTGGRIHGNGLGHPNGSGKGRGGGSCGYLRTKYVGASHGEVGGVQCGDSYSPMPPYGDAIAPTTFGSGGACGGGGGGGRLRVIAGRVIANGFIEENGLSSTRRALGSGGSVFIEADEILGGGIIKAEGGTCQGTSNCAAGGGGRIALHTDEKASLQDSIASSYLTVSVAGGGSGACDQAKGQAGSLKILCLSTSCFNGGKPLEEGCGCECVPPWGGDNCTDCLRQCANNGTLVSQKCRCECPEKWTGPTCNECNGATVCSSHGVCNSQQNCSCDFNYYTENCSVFCDASVNCSSNGVCSEEGTCVCSEEKAGPMCQCDVLDCIESTCSAKGTCLNGECMCEQGFYGCECDKFCSRSLTCCGSGMCQDDGTCECDPGWLGEDCCERNNDYYCTPDKEGKWHTSTGFPCLPGLHGNLGYGFDIVKNTKTQQIFSLRYSTGNFFKHNRLGTFEIPDNVFCVELPVDSRSSSSGVYTNSYDLRVGLAAELGISPVKVKSSFFSASTEFQAIEKLSFEQQRIFAEHYEYYPLYSCGISIVQPELSRETKESLMALDGPQLARSIGTHMIERAEIGGFLRSDMVVKSCAQSCFSAEQIRAEAQFALAYVVTGKSYVSNYAYFNSNARFDGQIGGGDKGKLRTADPDTQGYSEPWISSCETAPAVIRRFLYDITELLPETAEAIQMYEESNMGEEKTADIDADLCPEDDCTALVKEKECSGMECGCFSFASTVVIEDGAAPISMIEIGDRVLTSSGRFETVYGFAPRQSQVLVNFTQLVTSSGTIELTSSHLVYLNGQDLPVPASRVVIGDFLLHFDVESHRPIPTRVIAVDSVIRRGQIDPLTKSGTIVVNGIVASTYSAFQNHDYVRVNGVAVMHHHTFMSLLTAPLRMLCTHVSAKFCNLRSLDEGNWSFDFALSLARQYKEWPAILQWIIVLSIAAFGLICVVFEWVFDSAFLIIVACYILLAARLFRFTVWSQHIGWRTKPKSV